MLDRLFRRKRRDTLGEALYARAVEQARQPGFYADLGVPDRIDARFELYTLHVLLIVLRLRDEGDAGVEPAQTLFDAYVSALDHALRELGVGDVSMGRKMRALGQAMYGRMTAYEAPLREGDASGLSTALARNVFEQATTSPASDRLAAYAIAARSGLAAQPFDAVLAGQMTWPTLEFAA